MRGKSYHNYALLHTDPVPRPAPQPIPQPVPYPMPNVFPVRGISEEGKCCESNTVDLRVGNNQTHSTLTGLSHPKLQTILLEIKLLLYTKSSVSDYIF